MLLGDEIRHEWDGIAGIKGSSNSNDEATRDFWILDSEDNKIGAIMRALSKNVSSCGEIIDVLFPGDPEFGIYVVMHGDPNREPLVRGHINLPARLRPDDDFLD
ncbi:hypothetical protein AALP_AA8G075700 [Arabis alpina]|uniref:Uncharacterized protein n=1 Tax=Arabis alpina TaxID=50452 RepID=A0A087G5L8_ARAAL|nr:hypothetical protein AALP_AA8G075700 [Arabis alpina]